MSGKLGRIWRGIRTVCAHYGLGTRRYGYFAPYRFASEVLAHGEQGAVGWLEARWETQLEEFAGLIEFAAQYNGRYEYMERSSPERGRPHFDQEWFMGLDAVLAYALVRKHRPSRIIEVGSGYSTCFLQQAVLDGNIKSLHQCIDPAPGRRAIPEGVELLARPLNQVEPEFFAGLGAGDMLFVDGSHLYHPGTDTSRLIRDILPALNRGVLTHFHDILLPDPYPEEWAWRAYNEQDALVALLSGGSRFRTIAPSAFLRSRHPELLEGLRTPALQRRLETSLWLEVAEAL